ncbi:tetratricopeptide repeat protein [Neisseriaceae bacterium TC5R-5]|nr:tetratricopeptide repeat protein [Neisseriaceae bacterium TC5R-5]
MAFDLQEQEQIDAIKAFWQQWGKWIVSALVLAAVVYSGVTAYRYYEGQQSAKAAMVYDNVTTAATAKDISKLKSVVQILQNEFSSSAYATRASLLLAKQAYEKNDFVLAQSQLEWVLSNSKDEAEKAVARLRLVAVLLDQKRFDAAIAELNKEHPAAFDALYFDMRGDVLVAKGDKVAARDAYKAALAKLQADSPSREFVQIKLDALGE